MIEAHIEGWQKMHTMLSFHSDALSSILTAYSSTLSYECPCICNEFDVYASVCVYICVLYPYLWASFCHTHAIFVCVSVRVFFLKITSFVQVHRNYERIHIRHSVYNALYRIKVMHEWQCKCSIHVYRLHNLPELFWKTKPKIFVWLFFFLISSLKVFL